MAREPRFAPLTRETMSDAQRKVADEMVEAAGRADGPGGRHMKATGRFPGPYSFLLRSPELATRWRRLGDYILIQARYWTAQFEWWAHYPLALRAGLPQAVADDLKLGKRPASMQPDEEAVYDFCVELMRDKRVSDATFAKARALFTEQQIVDLVAVSGFYATVSMVLNTIEAEIPNDEPPPLAPLAAPLR